MRKNVLRWAVSLAAASILAAGGAVITTSPANAVPYQTGDRYKNCGATICTVYWSRPKTAEIYADTQSPGWAATRAAVIFGEARTLSIGRNQATLDGIENAAGEAVTYGGCLQYAYRADGEGKAIWSYTTHPDYCWDPAAFQF